ncbi:hypothetical protein HG536_0D00790 [Torulaspora globosa]|uniref:Uncharacterized protein n=1 Tax=Torulaspora globosa TaxID=48254 RepID=A0A7G3ZGC1_9SACH|nr:uncharacterized protein HG536_0D00790 [Torulaspora globosa]QLL32557.1 hypothetical protein HG536_0D00790 [Torulaspora globosa]
MRSRPLNTQASYLPSKKSQRVSEERIARINELYENIKRDHRDSVVSNNSTSVGSQEAGVDDCIPINNLELRLPKVNHIDQPNVKRENETISPFQTEQTSTPSVSRHIAKEFRASESHVESSYERDDDDDDDDLEAELRFTPKLKSRRSLLTMRRLSSSVGDRTNESFESVARPMHSGGRIRRAGRISSLRKTLGEPLPLPYVSKDNSADLTRSSNDPSLAKKSLESRRRLMEGKWRTLIARDKELIEKRFANLRQETSSDNKAIPANDSLPSISTTPERQQEGGILELSKEIQRNGEKLDDIIKLLSQRPAADTVPASPNSVSRETLFWTICIIVLILCNIYVYHYF